jgi:glycosyltransferase involved in cell wall biosynthesis
LKTLFTVSVVIPAYFEEKTIASVVERCLPFVDEVIVVNDGSTDDTTVNAQRAGARVIELEHNMGVMRATQRGIKEASGDIIVTLDADSQHDPSEIPRLVQPILEGKADLVMGERPTFPHLSEKILTRITSLRVSCRDVSTGFRAIKREIAKQMDFYGVCLCGTFVLEAARIGARVSCVPISIREREGPRRIQTKHIRQFFIVLREVVRFW